MVRPGGGGVQAKAITGREAAPDAAAEPVGFTYRVLGRRGAVEPGVGESVTVAPGGADHVRLEVLPAALLPAGVYEIEVQVNADVLPETARLRAELRAIETIGIGNLETRAGQLKQAVNLATRAAFRGDTVTMKEWAQKLLLMNPTSAVGFSLLGSAAETERNCSLAIENWKKALTILQTNSDPDAPELMESTKADRVAGFQRRIDRCR